MNISNTNHPQITKKSFSLPLSVFITFFLILLNKVYSADFTEFTFDNFNSPAPNLILQGDAKIDTSFKTIQLTKTDSLGLPQKNSVGRALYYAPVRLWEKSTNTSVAMFETTFTFVISSPTTEIAGDGIAFFFAPTNFTFPTDSDGGYLGIFSNETNTNQILAVEFDTYIDGKWDPNYRHIGIDVNTTRSQASTKWERVTGGIATVTISYNINNRILYVKSSYPNGEEYVLSSSIFLESVVPEWVTVGFSASTGDHEVETHNILSWTFSSWLTPISVAKKEDMVSAT